MRSVIRTSLILAATAMLLSLASPGFAKGAQRATIRSAALDHPVSVGPQSASLLALQTDLLTSLSLPGCRHNDRCTLQRPRGDLGPRYIITYTMLMPNKFGHEERSQLVQYLYPEARPKAVAYIPSGQRVPPWPTTRGIWVDTKRDLLFSVAGLDNPLLTPAPASLDPSVAAVEPDASPAVSVAAVVGAVVLITAAAVVVHRRHRSASPA
jgi:hypothetical protein